MAYETIETLPIITCGVGTQAYGLDMRFVSETVRTEEMHWEDNKTGTVGSVRGVPVYSLAQFLGQSDNSRPNETQRVVLLRTKEQGRWGLLVDHVSRVLSVQADWIKPVPSLIDSSSSAPLCFSHVISAPDMFLLMLSPERLHPSGARVKAPSTFDLTLPFLPVAANLRSKDKTEPGRLLIFSIGKSSISEREIVFGLSITQVLEVLKPQTFLPVPGASSLFLGLISWRDRPVPVIDIAARFGLPSVTISENSRVLICRVAGGRELVGLLTGSTMRMLGLPVPNEPCKRELAFNRSWCKAVVELSDETLVIPDVQKLFSSHYSLV